MLEILREGVARTRLFKHWLTHEWGPYNLQTVKGTVGTIENVEGGVRVEIYTYYNAPNDYKSHTFNFPSPTARPGLPAIKTGDSIITSTQIGAPIFTIKAAPRK